VIAFPELSLFVSVSIHFSPFLLLICLIYILCIMYPFITINVPLFKKLRDLIFFVGL
jgi:hypothetical protein